ncbi:hypothetical protein [Nostoc sp.]|uniref:hypothetical protein n=1 Tax=Nostoc sp. TaxID=1180 RepID=UPI002FFCF985
MTLSDSLPPRESKLPVGGVSREEAFRRKPHYDKLSNLVGWERCHWCQVKA